MLPHWWVELGLGSLMGMAVLRDMSRGDCGLRKALGSLSADGWGYDPALLNVWLFLSVLALEPTGYWVGPGLSTKNSSKISASSKSSCR